MAAERLCPAKGISLLLEDDTIEQIGRLLLLSWAVANVPFKDNAI